MELSIRQGSLCFNVCDRGVWCFPLSNTYQMTILVSTLIQSKAKVGENFSIVHQQYTQCSAGEERSMLVLVCAWSLMRDCAVCWPTYTYHGQHAEKNHVTGDICIMCSCVCHIPITLIVLLDYINLIMYHHHSSSGLPVTEAGMTVFQLTRSILFYFQNHFFYHLCFKCHYYYLLFDLLVKIMKAHIFFPFPTFAHT